MTIINSRWTHYDAFHDMRFHWCLVLLYKELKGLEDKRVDALMKKYSASIYRGMATLMFPGNCEPKKIPKHLKMKNEPINALRYPWDDQYYADRQGWGINQEFPSWLEFFYA